MVTFLGEYKAKKMEKTLNESVSMRKKLPQVSRSTRNIQQMENLLLFIHQSGKKHILYNQLWFSCF